MSLSAYTEPRADGSTPSPRKVTRVLDARRAARYARMTGDEKAAQMLDQIVRCKTTKLSEMSRLAALSDRFDNLYYPNAITEGGADHWPDDPNRKIVGRAHVSVNAYPIYVDLPAALLSTLPVENIVPGNMDEAGAKDMAAAMERVYFAWKDLVDYELKMHKGAVVSGLYGRTASKVWWDPDLSAPQFSIIDQPRNLWLGWADTEYTRLDWAIYVYRLTPNAVLEEFGLDVMAREFDGEPGIKYPVVIQDTSNAAPAMTTTYSRPNREFLAFQDLGMIEVHDYWYRRPEGIPKIGERTNMETWNAVIVGNVMVRNDKYDEYEGQLPYTPVFASYIPGVPDGRASLFDVEQLLREKDERLSAGATIISKATRGQMYQLVGAESPDKVPVGLKPEPDKIIGPGAGNRVEAITPWMPVFNLEQFLDRLDREITDVTGVGELLRGLAPAQVLSSGKAINALVAQYEARIAMRRDLWYAFRTATWDKAKMVWGNKVDRMKPIIEKASRLVVTNPSLTPRDDLEASTIAANMMVSKVWSQIRAMDRMGVEDPEAEQDQIRKERTDAALFPADVTAMAGLLGTFQQLGLNAQQGQAQGGGGTGPGMSPDQATAALNQQPGPQGDTSLNGPGEQPMGQQPGNAQEAALAQLLGGAPSPQSGPGFNAVQQTMVNPAGEAKSRVLLQQPIGPQGGPGG